MAVNRKIISSSAIEQDSVHYTRHKCPADVHWISKTASVERLPHIFRTHSDLWSRVMLNYISGPLTYGLGLSNNWQCPKKKFIPWHSWCTPCTLSRNRNCNDNNNYGPLSLTQTSPLSDFTKDWLPQGLSNTRIK